MASTASRTAAHATASQSAVREMIAANLPQPRLCCETTRGIGNEMLLPRNPQNETGNIVVLASRPNECVYIGHYAFQRCVRALIRN